ncbi:hypothetical protein [Paenibacillus daejeonensis]|uniref:hypothetical protein n=1 Tax=Paenibacillus daejeonensis TaxID=135193 RepID=UPI001B7F7EBD|nr:hypothetical protein [Paenibacillus daejeonensis]
MIMVTIVFLSYGKYERSILSFKLIIHLLVGYIFLIELTYAVRRQLKLKSKILTKAFFVGLYLFGISVGLIASLQFYNTFSDAFITGFEKVDIVILHREPVYNDSDRIYVTMDDEREVFSLAPGYVEVEPDSSYRVHAFMKSKIVVPIEAIIK